MDNREFQRGNGYAGVKNSGEERLAVQTVKEFLSARFPLQLTGDPMGVSQFGAFYFTVTNGVRREEGILAEPTHPTEAADRMVDYFTKEYDRYHQAGTMGVIVWRTWPNLERAARAGWMYRCRLHFLSFEELLAWTQARLAGLPVPVLAS